MSPGPRRTTFAFLAAVLACLVLALCAISLAPPERDTGPGLTKFEPVIHPAAIVLSVALEPAAALAAVHELVLDDQVNDSMAPAPSTAARYESVSSGLGRRLARHALPGPQIRYAHRARTSLPLRC